MQGAQVRSLVRELRYHMLCAVGKKKTHTQKDPLLTQRLVTKKDRFHTWLENYQLHNT